MAKLTFVPHVAADADDTPRRREWQTHARLAALIPRPAAASERNVAYSRMVSGSQRCARAARFVMKRPRSVVPSVLNNSDTHITLWLWRQLCSRAISASVRPVMPASLACKRRG